MRKETIKKVMEASSNFDDDTRLQNAFLAGVNWQRNNVWHDASDKPDGNGYVLCYDGKNASVAHYKEVIGCKWAYLEDLLPVIKG